MTRKTRVLGGLVATLAVLATTFVAVGIEDNSADATLVDPVTETPSTGDDTSVALGLPVDTSTSPAETEATTATPALPLEPPTVPTPAVAIETPAAPASTPTPTSTSGESAADSDSDSNPEAANAPTTTVDSAASLQVSAPARALTGESFEVQVVVPASVAGFETHLSFDRSAVSFVGARLDSEDHRLLAPETNEGVALAVFGCSIDNCTGEDNQTAPAGIVTLRFTAEDAGSASIIASQTRLVDALGGVINDPSPASTAISIDGSSTARSGAATNWTLAAAGRPDPASFDQTGDGLVRVADLTEVVLGWRELRWQGAPCSLSKPRLKALDVDANGCIDIADVQAVAGALDAASSLPRFAATPGLFVVDSDDDDADANLSDLVCATASGECTLRAAISQANWKVGPDRIEFDIPGSGPHTIELTDRLPTINDPTGGTVIDGYTQPGATPNTDPLASNANIMIEIEGEGFINGVISFTITGPGNEIWGLAVYDSWRPFEILYEEADGNVIAGNFIGTDAAGTFEYSSGTRGDGLNLNLGPDRNQIGVPTLAGRNVIAGNGSWGLRINHGETSQNRIQNNIIGINPTGTDRLEQLGGIDVQWWTWGNLVGGADTLDRNVFSGHTGVGGIDFSHSSTGNQAIGNFIGTDLTGDAAEVWSANNRGISIKDNPQLNHFEGNVIGNASSDGIWHKHNYTGKNTFVDNRVGVGVNGGDIGNGRYGMHLTGHNDIYYGNTFANNGSAGVYISDYNDTNPNYSNYPAERTAYNELHQSIFFNNAGLDVDIDPIGFNANDPGDTDTGTHDYLNYPEITSAAVGEAFGTTCPGCTVELYVAAPVLADGTVDVANPLECVDAQRIEAENATISGEFVAVVDAAASGGEYMEVPEGDGDGSGPASDYLEFSITVTVPGDFTLWGSVLSPDGTSDSFFVTVDGAPGAGYLWDTAGGTYVVDQVNDRTLGDLTFTLAAGTHTVQVHLREDGTGLDWLELGCNLAVDGMGWLNTAVADSSGDWSVADAGLVAGGTMQALAIDLDGDTSELSPTRLVADPTQGGAAAGTGGGVDPDAPDEPGDHVDFVFTCSVDASNLLSWNSPYGATTFYVRQAVGATETYLGSTSAFQYQLGWGADTVFVRYFRNSQAVDTSCAGPGPQPFDCSVTGFSLSWTDNGASTYYIRKIIGGVDTYVGSATGTTYTLASASDTIRVFYWAAGGQIEAQCPGPVAVPFECSVTGFSLSWTDAGASTYYIRKIIGGVDAYVGETSATSYTLAVPSDTLRVFYFAGGVQTEAQCAGPVYTCMVSGFDLTWDNTGASTYFIRQILGGVETYLGSSTTTSYTLTNPATSIVVLYWHQGVAIEATCPGPPQP